MQRRQRQAVESYERVKAFTDQHPLEGKEGYGAPKILIDRIVAQLGSHGTEQESGRRREHAQVVLQRGHARELREMHLRPIAQVSRAVLEQVPEVSAMLRLPAPNISHRRLVTKALAVRELAATHEQLLGSNGCERDFLARLDAAIDTMRAGFLGRETNRGRRAGARVGIEHEIRRGRAAVEMIDALVRRRFAKEPVTLAAWRMARRVRVVAPATQRPELAEPAGGVAPATAA